MEKIILAQLNPITGNIEYNKNKVVENIKKAKKDKADLIVFPELFLLGYPLGDILLRFPHLANQTFDALNEIKTIAPEVGVLIGFAEKNNEKTGKPFYNSVAYLKDGEIKQIIRKSLIPNYAEHNEYRYFEPYRKKDNNRIIDINGTKFAIIICEDGWNDFDFFHKNLYDYDPVYEINKKADVFLCIASSPTRAKKEQLKHNMMKFVSKKYKKKYIYINQAGANDELVYDGFSRVYDENGEIIARASGFEEDYFLLNNFKGKINPLPKGLECTLNSQKEFSLDHRPDLERTYKAIVLAIKDYFSKNGFKKAVLGLSGGLDSTACAVLLADALGADNVLGVSMPSKLTSKGSKDDAQKLACNLGINFITVPIKDAHEFISNKFNNMFENLKWHDKCSVSYTQDNIQARFRSMILWAIANEYQGCLPIATSDKSELYMGYATINGDMSGGYAPISDVVKTKLFALCHWMNENRKIKNVIPVSILNKPPGAELAINPKTGKPLLAEEALMPYEFMDEIIWRLENLNQTIDNMLEITFLYEKKNKISKEIKKQWLEKFYRRMNNALYKWYIVPPGPIIDARSINKTEYKQPIISNLDYNK